MPCIPAVPCLPYRLFALHGAPLILKIDNGSAFRADEFKQMLETSRVIPLYSPPSCPGYNGAIEAAIGSLKKRTEDQAHAHGHSGHWALSAAKASAHKPAAAACKRLHGSWQSEANSSRLEPTGQTTFFTSGTPQRAKNCGK
jgi:transposase InsO family protein